MELEEYVSKYKNITLNIMNMVTSEDYENLDKYFRERQLILDYIVKYGYSKEELKNFYLKYNISELEKNLEKEMIKRKEELLIKIKTNQKRRIAMNGYNNLQSRAVFLSKEF